MKLRPSADGRFNPDRRRARRSRPPEIETPSPSRGVVIHELRVCQQGNAETGNSALWVRGGGATRIRRQDVLVSGMWNDWRKRRHRFDLIYANYRKQGYPHLLAKQLTRDKIEELEPRR
jgi:hypothetical protein